MTSSLRVILGDQLSLNIATLKECDKANDIIVMCEVWDEATYVPHHKKKIAFIFSVMRHYADHLRNQGFNVHYTRFENPENTKSFTGEVEKAIQIYAPQSLIITYPGEYRVLSEIKSWEDKFRIPILILEDDRFLLRDFFLSLWLLRRFRKIEE